MNMRATLIKAKARCPSILTLNLMSTKTEESESEEENYLHVYLRIKAGIDNFDDLYVIRDSRTLISKIPAGSFSARNTKYGDSVEKKYDFSKIFGPETKQEELFNELVEPKLLKCINGQNCTLMTYGVSSSGKTYTIVGTAQEPGMLPRSLEYIFKTLPQLPPHPTIKPLPDGRVVRLNQLEIDKEVEMKESILNFNWPNGERMDHINVYRAMQAHLSQESFAVLECVPDVSVAVWVSFAEIYNEHIYDLLQPQMPNGPKKNKLKLGSSNGNTYIKNLTQVYVSSGLEAYQVLQYGLNHLNYAKTKINAHSSRSHSIFTIKLAQVNNALDEDYSLSHINFCDLAGAERLKKTMNVGERLKESNNINTSLLVLGRCIAGVRNAQKASDHRLIPFRESKLTQIFQKALSGHEDICMVVNVNPCRELFDETQHVLNFSAVAKEIVIVHQHKEQPVQARRFSELVQARSTEFPKGGNDPEVLRLLREVQELKDEISEYVNKIEIEEMDQIQAQIGMREKTCSKYENILDEKQSDWDFELTCLTKRLKEQNKKMIRDRKVELFDSLRVNCELSISSESSDDEVNELYTRKRKHSDAQTITVFDSDDEDQVDFLKSKLQIFEKQIKEHHETISVLETELTKKIKRNQLENEELQEKIRHSEIRIKELESTLENIG